MPDEATQAPGEVQDTPQTDAAPEVGKPAAEPPANGEEDKPTVDFEKRYNDLRPEYDRANQLLAAARGEHGPEAQVQALQQLGVNVQQEAEEEDDPFEDPDERTQREVAELREKMQQREEAEEWAQFEQLEGEFVNSTLDQLEQDENLKLSSKERKWIETQGKANRLESGEPNLQGAFDDLKGIKSAARDEYLASKKQATKAPAGAVGEDKIDLSDKDKRNQWMAEQIRPALEDEGS
jgi:hypothetical protein